ELQARVRGGPCPRGCGFAPTAAPPPRRPSREGRRRRSESAGVGARSVMRVGRHDRRGTPTPRTLSGGGGAPPAPRRPAADKLDAQRDVDLDALHGLQDVAVEHDVGRTSEADDQPLAEVVVEERLAGGEAAVDPERVPYQPPRGHGAADHVKESTLAVAEVG